MPKATSEQLVKINRFTQVPLTEEQVYVFPNMMIDNAVTSYFSIVHPNLLSKFQEDAIKGVALLTNHNHYQLPVGRSFDASMTYEVGDDGNSTVSLVGMHYIDLGRNTQSGMTTDDITKGIDAGTIFDTSVGFNSKSWECSICENDIRNWRLCEHVPGHKYAVQREGKDVVETCYVITGKDGNGELLENSLVYAGACKRATIIKENLSAGNVSDNDNRTKLHLVDSFKDIPLEAAIFQYYTSDGSVLFTDTAERTNGSQELKKRSEQQMELEKLMAVLGKFSIEGETPEAIETALQALTDAQSELAQKEATFNEQLAAETAKYQALEADLEAKDATIADLEATNSELTEKAGVADTYRQDLIDSTIAMGVRAHGNGFKVDLFTKFLSTLSLDEIKSQLSAFEGEVQERFGGSRQSGTGVKPRAKGDELFREDFETDSEWGNYINDKVVAYMKENKEVSLGDATKLMVKKYSKKESE